MVIREEYMEVCFWIWDQLNMWHVIPRICIDLLVIFLAGGKRRGVRGHYPVPGFLWAQSCLPESLYIFHQNLLEPTLVMFGYKTSTRCQLPSGLYPTWDNSGVKIASTLPSQKTPKSSQVPQYWTYLLLWVDGWVPRSLKMRLQPL